MSNSTRSSSSSNSNSYDERFVVPLEASRRGAHRARVSPLMAILPVAAVVGTVVGAIALVYLFLGGMGGSSSGPDTTAAASPTTTASSTSAPSGSGGTGPSGGASSSLAPGAVDKTITLDVFNGTTTSGLAKKAGNKLTAAGWTTGRIETWTGAPVSQSTVYYGRDDQKASALAVVKILGRGTVKLSPSKAGEGFAVVIGPDYPGATAARTNNPTAKSTGATSSRSTTRTAGGSTTSSPKATGGASSTTKASGSTSSSTGESTTDTTDSSS